MRQGTRTAAVLLEPGSFATANGQTAAADAQQLPIDDLMAGNVVTYVVPAESDISLMLGPAGLAADAAPERQRVAVR